MYMFIVSIIVEGRQFYLSKLEEDGTLSYSGNIGQALKFTQCQLGQLKLNTDAMITKVKL